jgi:hypothetical protein
MARYQIWDKISDVYTRGRDEKTGKSHFTATEWLERYPIFHLPGAVPVLEAGIYNGGFCGELSEMVRVCAASGADFSQAVTNEEKLAVIEAFEDGLTVANAAYVKDDTRIADALEDLVVLQMPDMEVN